MSLPLQGGFDQTKDLFQRGIETGYILATGLGHLGAPAARAPDFRGQDLNQISGFEFADQIFRHHH